jgi:hypothetical protein
MKLLVIRVTEYEKFPHIWDEVAAAYFKVLRRCSLQQLEEAKWIGLRVEI